MQKKTFNSGGKRQLQVFSKMMQMKFKPRSNTATTAIVQKNKKMISKSQKNLPQLDLSRSTMSRLINNDKKLKYLSSLSPEYFLIGNENQIDMIGILGIAHNFVDTDYCWSLSDIGPIECLAVEPRKCLIAIVSEKKLYFYKYNIKKCKQEPELIKDFDIKPDVKFLQFPKDSLLGLFYEKDFEIYNVEEHKKIYKKCFKPYNEPQNLKLFAVPQVVENNLKIFFIEEQAGSKTFGLWFIKVNIELSTIQLEKPQKVYDIKRNLKKMLVVENFSKDIIFMNIGAEILAAKNGYILDSANVNIQSGNAKLKYISNQRLIHISDKKLQVYKMNILTNVVPNKIQVSSIDALQIIDKPHQAQFFGLVSTVGDNFGIFYQNMSQFNIFKKGQASYWFALTQSISLDEKIRRLFNYNGDISALNPELLQQKCDMARKMGLNEKQLYLQIWNRSNKNTIKDYQFILATRNYKTIHSQIEKKLKKQSMSFRQLLKIQQSCMIILKQSVYGQKCTQQNIQQYLTSHCFIKKLKLFKDIQLYRKQVKKSTIKFDYFQQDQNKLLINIQQYYEYKEFDIKNYLVEKIADFCLYDKPNRQLEIRMMLRTFKFVYRVIYKEILEEIIKLCKGKLVILLKAIPEILPYVNNKTQSQLQPNEQLALYDGIWGEIKHYEWQRNLFVENITTIDNKQTVIQFIKSIWYKRYWLTAHELVNLNKENIILLNKENNSQLIFYFFISKIFEIISDEDTQFQIIYFLDENYSLIPQHLQGKIFLYYNLHKFYKENHHKAKLPPMKLDEFLNLNDAQLFSYFFTQEKHTKNCILKSIKRIYEETCEDTQGLHLFNEGLLAYFKSDLSQISDLKYLLNRMNNQKTQFHDANLSIYAVLVRAMQYKLKIGSYEDIPIDQVLIYIQNIPISRDQQVMQQLYIVKRINEQSERFRKMKINMTIKEIIDNFEDVISKVVQYEFEVNKIRKKRNEKQLTEITYKVLAQVQVVQQKIYGMERNPALPFFIYLAKLLEDVQQIKLAKLLLANEFIKNYFPVDEVMIENLVLYMYKWVFSKDHAFLANEKYIEELLTLLPQDNEHRRFIENETSFAIALSSKNQPLEYPISLDNQYPGLFQLGEILRGLNINHVVKVNIEFIYKTMRAMQDISLAEVQKSQSQIGISTIEKISQHEVYSAFIIKMIEDNHLNDAIIVMKKLLKLPVANKRYNMVYFALLIQKLSSELNDESKNIMTRMISFCFDEPQKLFEFIEYYLNSKEIALAKSKTLRRMMQQYIKGRVNFNKDNFLFNHQSKLAFSNPQMQQNSIKLFYEKSLHLKRTKSDFLSIEYDILFSIITNQPYLAAKFIQANQDHINFKTMRSYLSYVIQQHLFDQLSFIEYCKKIFAIVLESNIKRKQISRIIFNQKRFHFHYGEIRSLGIQDEIDKRIQKTYRNFEKKKKSILNFSTKKSSSIDRQQQSIHQIHIQLLNPDELSSQNPSEYPFSDSDNDLNNQQPVVKKSSSKKKKKSSHSKQFNITHQRNRIMKRKNSFFGDKSSQMNRSRNSQAYDIDSSQDDKFSSSKMSLSLKVPDVKRSTKIYMKRSTKNKQVSEGMLKKVSLVIEERQQSSSSPSKLKNIQKRQSYSFGQSPTEEQANIMPQQSQYSIKEIAQLQQEDPVFRIKNLLLNSFDPMKDKIDFEILVKQQTTEQFSQNLKQVLVKIYEDREIQNKNKVKLIRLICQKYPKIFVNQIVLAVYDNIQKVQEKYALGLPIDRMLPFDGLLIESKQLDDLFKLVLPRIVDIATDETIFKLSKLISFGFRKNIYEAEISFEYIRKMIDSFTEEQSEVELNMRLEIIKSLLSKMSILSLKEKAPKMIQGIFANPTLIRKIIDLTFESVKKRGDAISATQIKKNMQKVMDK